MRVVALVSACVRTAFRSHSHLVTRVTEGTELHAERKPSERSVAGVGRQATHRRVSAGRTHRGGQRRRGARVGKAGRAAGGLASLPGRPPVGAWPRFSPRLLRSPASRVCCAQRAQPRPCPSFRPRAGAKAVAAAGVFALRGAARLTPVCSACRAQPPAPATAFAPAPCDSFWATRCPSVLPSLARPTAPLPPLAPSSARRCVACLPAPATSPRASAVLRDLPAPVM